MRIITFCIFVVSLMLPFNLTHANPTQDCELPTVKFLGEDVGQYTLEEGYTGFLVKRWDNNGLVFEYVDGRETFTLNESDNGSGGHKSRIWQTTSLLNAPEFFIDGVKELGEIKENSNVQLLVLDNDTFPTLIVNESENVLTTSNPSFVQYIEFTTRHTGNYYVRSAGSIAVIGVCITEVIPTPTYTYTAAPTNTATMTPEPTETPVATVTAHFTPSVPTGLTPYPESMRYTVYMPFIAKY